MDIRVKRESKGLTQEELGGILGVTRSTVAMWETGSVSPRASLMPALAKALGCTIDDLYRKED